MNNKTKTWVWVGLIILLLVVWLVLNHQTKPVSKSVSQPAKGVASQKVSSTPTSTPTMSQVASVPAAQVPPGMPANLPWEKGATVLQNFTVKDPATGKTQSTRAYVSSKSLDSNFAAYQAYLKKNGWTVVSSIDQPAIKNVSATKSGARLDIIIAKNSQGQVIVNVTYLD